MKKTSFYNDFITLPAATTVTQTVYSSVLETPKNKSEVLVAFDSVGFSAGSVAYEVQTGTKKPVPAQAISAEDTFANIASGSFTVKFSGRGFASKNNPTTYPLVDVGTLTVNVGATGTTLAGYVNAINLALQSTVVATSGEIKNQVLAHYLVAKAINGALVLETTYVGDNLEMKITDSTYGFTTGSYYGSDYTYIVAKSGTVTNAEDKELVSVLASDNLQDFVRLKLSCSGATYTSFKADIAVYGNPIVLTSAANIAYKTFDTITLGNNDVYTSDAIELNDKNAYFDLYLNSTTVTSGVTYQLQTSFGTIKEIDYDINNNTHRPHISKVVTAENATWYNVGTPGSITAAGNSKVSLTSSIGKYVRYVLTADATGVATIVPRAEMQ